MRKSLIGLTTLAMVASAASVSAQDPMTGFATMDRNGGAEPCTHISWVGTLEVDGQGDMDGTFGYALSKAEDIPASVFADGWMRWAEYFTLYDEVFERDADGLLASCEPGAVLLHGYESGVGQAEGALWDTGYVLDADGRFEGMEGAKVDRLGTFTQWEGTLPDGNPGPIAFTGELVVQPQTELGQ